MDEAKKKRGGPGRGQGRKPLDVEPSEVIHAKVKRSQKEKFARIGGAKWLRKKIDDEPEPDGQ